MFSVPTHPESLEKSGNLRVVGKSLGKCVLACEKFCQLVLRKIIELVATGSQILRLNAPNSISAGAGFKGAYF